MGEVLGLHLASLRVRGVADIQRQLPLGNFVFIFVVVVATVFIEDFVQEVDVLRWSTFLLAAGAGRRCFRRRRWVAPGALEGGQITIAAKRLHMLSVKEEVSSGPVKGHRPA